MHFVKRTSPKVWVRVALDGWCGAGVANGWAGPPPDSKFMYIPPSVLARALDVLATHHVQLRGAMFWTIEVSGLHNSMADVRPIHTTLCLQEEGTATSAFGDAANDTTAVHMATELAQVFRAAPNAE